MRAHLTELSSGIKQMGLALTEHQQNLLLDYVDLLVKWNKAYNLTAVRDPQEMISRHILDSLSIIPFINGARVLDVGTGPGLPGIPLAIAFPNKEITLVDSNGKKTRFLREAQLALKLSNIKIEQTRAENLQSAVLFDCITSRAFADLGNMVAATAHLLAPHGEFVAMKGQLTSEELSSIDKHYKVQVHPIKVPGSIAARHAVMVMKQQ